jgi:hypothetical protein
MPARNPATLEGTEQARGGRGIVKRSRRKEGCAHIVLDGADGVTYDVGTVQEIDASLETLSRRPGHPDIDRLLDARLLVGTLDSPAR